ncbi:hypothetical protein V6N12_073446 [Hibiscus sabdariffa]|uniref:RNase H type-1 domain-containing protein n=1 Tax=Hibiscus sabdariffa TaxID=183260 RepID=A0ABR2AW66_9ROSI
MPQGNLFVVTPGSVAVLVVVDQQRWAKWRMTDVPNAQGYFRRWPALVAKSIGNASLSRSTPLNIGSTLIGVDQWLWGAYYVLIYTWEADFRQVVLDLDSLEAICILMDDFNGVHSLQWHLQELCSRDWSVRFQFTKHYGNNVADALAKSANVDSLESTLFTRPPSWLVSLLHEDVNH